MSTEGENAGPAAKTTEPAYVFGSDLAGSHEQDSAKFAARAHRAEPGKGSGPSGNAYAIPYRSSEGHLLEPDVIRNYVDSFFRYAEEHPATAFQVARFGCESGAHSDEDMARLFSRAPPNCQLPGVWTRIRDPKQPGRLLLFDPGAHLKDAAWQEYLRKYLALNAPLWDVPSIELVSVGAARAIVANDIAAKSLGLRHRVIGPNGAYYGKNAPIAAENKAIWYSTHLLSMFDFDVTAQPQQIRIMTAATRSGLQVEQLDTNILK